MHVQTGLDDKVPCVPCRDPDSELLGSPRAPFSSRGANRVLDLQEPEGQWVNVEVWRAREDALKAIEETGRRCEEWTMDETSALARRRRARRRFGVISALFGAGLLVCGALLSGGDKALDAGGLACVAYGIGLLVAGVWLALGHNPLDRRRR